MAAKDASAASASPARDSGAGESLRRSEERFRTIFSQSPVGLEIYDREGRLIDANAACLEMFGVSDLEAVKGFKLFEDPNIPKDARERLRDGQAVKCEKEFDFDLVRQKKLYETTRSGRCYVDCVITPWEADEDGPGGFLVHVRDITDRKLAEQALRENETRYRSLVSHLPAVTWQSDADGNTTFISSNVQQVYGYTPEEICESGDRLWFGRVHPDDVARVKKAFASILEEGKPLDIEYRIQRKDGQWIWLQDKSTGTHEENGRQCASGVFFDITERKQAEETLHSTLAALRELTDIVNRSPMLFFRWRVAPGEWPVELVSDNVESVLGYTADDFTSGRVTWPGITHPDDVSRLEAEVAQHLAEGAEEWAQEYRLIMKSGEVRWFRDRNLVMRDDRGSVTHIQSVVRDVTERRRAEVSLSERSQLLETIFGTTHVLMAYMDTRFNFIQVNHAYAAADGREPSFFPGKNHFDLYPNEENKTIFQRVVQTAEAYKTYAKPFAYAEHPERGITYWDWSLDPTVDETGKVTGLVLALANVTDRKVLENTVRESENLLHAAIDNLPFDFWARDMDGRCIMQNATSVRAWGNLLGSLPDDSDTSSETLNVWRQNNERAYAGEVVSGETELETLEGKGIFHNIVAPIRDGDDIRGILGLNIDITEQKRAEEALARERDKAQSYLQLAGTIFVAIDADQRVSLINRKGCEILGWSQENIIGVNWFDRFVPERQRAQVKAAFEQLMTGKLELVEYLENPILTRSGEERLIAWHNAVIRDDKGVIVGTLSSGDDITERKRAREDLERMFNLSGYMICIAGLDGYFKRVNPAFEETLGYTSKELLDRPFFDFVHPDDAERTRAVVREELSGGANVIGFENRYRCKDGSYKWLGWTSQPVVEEGIMYAIAYDITERKQAEEELIESEARFRELVEHLREVFWMENADGTELLYVSPAFEEIWGMSCESFYENPKVWVESIHPDDRERVSDAVARTRHSGIFSEEFRIVRPDGSIRWIRDRGSVVRDETGSINRVLGVAEDITERKQAEEERRQIELQMQHAQKLESLGILAGGIAHDFNNLLTGVLGNAELALLELPGTAAARNNLEEIRKTAIRASELTNQMLAYSGKGHFVVESLDLNQLVRDMTNLLEVSISKSVTLKLDLAQDLPAVEADAAQVRQVVMNLITNASEAISDREGVIALRTVVKDVGRRYLAGTQLGKDLPEGRYVVLEVADTGCGMDKATQLKIFDPFFTTKFTGRGLGLASLLGIVRGHRGAIRVRSKPGKGTTFRVLLPAAETPVQTGPPEEGRPGEAWRGSGTVLVVDDQETVRDVAQRMLENVGFDVLTAADGREAVEVFDEHADRIVAVLLDMTMPRMGGEETFTRLRKIRADVPVILSSGYDEHDATTRFGREDLAGFIQKPFRMSNLVAKFRTALES